MLQADLSKSMGKNPKFKPWLAEVKGKPTKAFCRICKREMTAVVTTLQKYRTIVNNKTIILLIN